MKVKDLISILKEYDRELELFVGVNGKETMLITGACELSYGDGRKLVFLEHDGYKGWPVC